MSYDVIIIGGGICGLVAGYNLAKNGLKTLILEREKEVGGLLGSYKFDKFTIEKYYHHVFKYDRSFFSLIAELGLENELIWRKASVGQYLNGKIYKLDTPIDIALFPALNFQDKIRLARFVLKIKSIKNYKSYDKISAVDWIIKLLGIKIFENFFKPLLIGKFGRNFFDASAAWLLNRLKLRSNRSLFGEKLCYMKNSFEVLLNNLVEKVRNNGAVLIGADVKNIITKATEVIGVKTINSVFHCNKVISTISSRHLSKICKFPEYFVSTLNSFKYQGVICLLLGLKEPLTKTYWLNINSNSAPFALLVEHTNFIQNSNYDTGLVYISSYIQDIDDAIWKLNDNEIFSKYLSHLEKMFDFDRKKVKWWRLARSKESSPIFDLGYLSRIPTYMTPIKGLYITGMMHSYPERNINGSIFHGLNCSNLLIDMMN